MPEQEEFKRPDISKMHYTCWEIAKDTYAMNYGGNLSMYLLVGKKKALLIDTCYGFGDIPGMVRRYTDLPVEVVNTHNHGDHTGGNAFFKAVHLYNPPFMIHSIPGSRPLSEMPFPNYRKIAISDGHVFDLGSRSVEVIAVPAHNQSSIALLDRQTGFLFTGDEIEAGQVLIFESGQEPIVKHLENMKKLWSRRSEISALVPAHNGAPVNPELIHDFIQLDESILSGTQQIADDPVFTRMVSGIAGGDTEGVRAVYGKASLVYLQQKAYDPSFLDHDHRQYIKDCLDRDLMSVDQESGFYPDKPVSTGDLVAVINQLARLFDGNELDLPTGQVADNRMKRKDAYILIAISLKLVNALGKGQSAMSPGEKNLEQNCLSALMQYETPLYFLDHDQWMTRSDLAAIASILARKKRLIDLFTEGVVESNGDQIPYRLYTPSNLEPGKKYPLVLFLHGGGEQGFDNQVQLLAYQGGTVWVEQHIEHQEPACFVLAPQAVPSSIHQGWDQERCRAIMNLIDQLAEQQPVDTSRLYCTGMSMGGLGTWTMNLTFPERFATMVSICGTVGTHPDMPLEMSEDIIGKLKDKPIWMFHAEDDHVADVNVSRNTYDILIKGGASNAKYTEYPASEGWDHFSWLPTYENKEMRQWVFEQSLERKSK